MPNYENNITAKVKFLSGPEVNILKFLPDALPATRANAEEGAFYLTTDTHRLFIGQKSTDSNDDNIYAEEIGRGVAIVDDINDLPLDRVTPNGTHAVQDGDFYYIKKRNILCVYEGPEVDSSGNTLSAGRWQQINANSTGIDEITQTTTEVSGTIGTLTEAINPVQIETALKTNTDEPDIIGKIVFQAGDNVTLSTGQITVPNSARPLEVIRISSENSQSELTVEDTTTSEDTSLILSDGVNEDTFVNFEGGNEDISISSYKYKQISKTEAESATEQIYTYNGSSYNPTSGPYSDNEIYFKKVPTVVIHSSQVSGGYVVPRNDENDDDVTGFLLGTYIKNENNYESRFPYDFETNNLNGKTVFNAVPYVNDSGQGNILDPIIAYGSDGQTTTTSSKFRNNTATLNVYTTTEVDDRIESAISSSLQAADAMTYKGAYTTEINEDLIISHALSQGYIHIGDTYKANHTHDENSVGNSVEKTWDNANHELLYKTGDLIIFSAINGQEDEIDSNTGETYISWNNLKFEVIPSGDEPWVASSVDNNNITLYNANNPNSAVNSILKLSFTDGDKVTARVFPDENDSSINNIQFNHEQITLSTNQNQNLTFNKSNAYLQTPQYTDSINDNTKGIKFFGLDPTLTGENKISGLTIDRWGHVTGIQGQEITLYHNYTNTLAIDLDNSPLTENSINYNRAIINITPYDYLGVYSGPSGTGGMGAITLKSSSLAISTDPQGAGVNSSGTISIEMEWDTF